MPIFFTDTGSLGRLEVTGSTILSSSIGHVLKIQGSGSNIFSISGSNGSLFEISDTTPSGVLFTIQSSSIDVLTIGPSKNVNISGSLNITGSIIGTSPTNLATVRFEMGISSTTAITTGAKGRKTVPYTGTIVGWKLVSDTSTTTVLDIWKTNNAIPTVANSITAGAKPSLTAAQLSTSTTLTGWTTSVSPNDVFILNVDSNNNATYLSLELDILLN